MSAKRKIVQTMESRRAVPGGSELQLSFRLPDEPRVPAVLLLPDSPRPAPAALLLHGWSSRKEEMVAGVGRALLQQGIGSLAFDLVMHGTRADPAWTASARNPLAMVRLWRQCVAEARLALRYLAARPEADAERLAVIGFSLGSYLAVTVAADEPLARAVVLAAGGDLPEGTAMTTAARLVCDPLRSVRRLRGRPLLMVHGRRDRIVLPEQAERLFAAASEPKEIRWLDAGHRLPAGTGDDVALWLKRRVDGAAEREQAG